MKKTKPFALLAALLLLPATLISCGGGGEESSSTPAPSDTSSSGPVPTVTTSEGSDSSQAKEDEHYEDVDFHGTLRVYYHNDSGDYANKRIYAWGPGLGGTEYDWDNASSASSDSYGVYKIFHLDQEPWSKIVSTTFSFIIKNAGTWSGQSTDTVVPFGRFVPHADDSGMVTIYACDGEGNNIDTFVSAKDALGDRVKSAYFSSWTNLHLVGGGAEDGRSSSEIGKISSYKVYAFDNVYLASDSETKAAIKDQYVLKTGDASSNEVDIALSADAVKPYLQYLVEAKMADDPSRSKSKVASFTPLFDTPEFISNYTYSGNDLGVTGNHSKITFKLWAPTSSRVQIKIFMAGTPGSALERFQPSADDGRLFEMQYGDHGVWQLAIDWDYFDIQYPYFYTYLVTNSMGTNETIDPYAQSSGINGTRGAIFLWDELAKPNHWEELENGTLLPAITAANQLSVYEAHIRDLTMDETWNGQERAGTFNAFVESGTTYAGTKADGSEVTVKTGFDHIVETGVNAVQLLPVFDQDNDERWKDADDNFVCYSYDIEKAVKAPDYNWGYNPLNYNCVEGAYASDPFDGLTKVKEFQNLVAKFAEKGIRVIMDVVYNHFSSINGNPLQKVVPDYFLRKVDGAYWDGTGVGNVTASERVMMRKFIVDSCLFWAKNYQIKGFRFDLMGCLDTKTMRAVKDALYDYDPSIVVYGEGWAGNPSGDTGMRNLPSDNHPAMTDDVYKYLGDNGKGSIGCFNDRFRDGVKGNCQNSGGTTAEVPDWGFISKGPNDVNNEIKARVGEGFLGANVNNKDSFRGSNPAQTVSYVACHDNYTLYDQLNYAINYLDGNGKKADIDDTTGEVFDASVASMGACFLNQGIAFLNGGDEIFRQKIMKPDDPMYEKLVESYKQGSYRHEDGRVDTWWEGDGYEMASGNWLVRNSYQYGDAVNSFKWDRKAKYYDYYQKVVEVIALRGTLMENLFGRSESEIKSRTVNNVFNSTYDPEKSSLVACYLGGRDGSTYYLLLGGRMSDTYTSLSCGSCEIEVVYSSPIIGLRPEAHYAGQTFSVSDSLGAAKYELMLVKVS